MKFNFNHPHQIFLLGLHVNMQANTSIALV
jgi:hypothetical protein